MKRLATLVILGTTPMRRLAILVILAILVVLATFALVLAAGGPPGGLDLIGMSRFGGSQAQSTPTSSPGISFSGSPDHRR